MKFNKRIMALALAAVALVCLSIGIWQIISQGRYRFDSKDLSVFDDNRSTFYLQRMDKDIVFKVQCDSKVAPEFTLVDENGNSIQPKIRKTLNKCYDVLPPKGGYSEGEQYTLSLPNNASFYSEELKDARTLVFNIDKKEIETYEFNDTVVQADTVIEKAVSDTLDITNLNVTTGDIVLGQDENNEYWAYKIAEIDANGIATVTTPAIDEIYSDLEVYGEYTWDLEDMVSNSDFEVEIIENVKQSSFFDALMISAYAEDEPEDAEFDIKIKPDNRVIIRITLKPGQNGLFGISTLKNQKVSIILNIRLDLTTNCNIESVSDWDISATLTNDFSWEVELTFYNKDIWEKESDLEGLFSKENRFADLVDYHNNVRKITEQLNQLTADATAGEIKLADWKLPIPSVPGLYFSSEIKVFANVDIAAEAKIDHSSKTVYVVGVCCKKGDFRAYSNTISDSKGTELSLSGKGNAKAGLKLTIKATVINEKIGGIKFEPQIGMYADFYVTYPISNTKQINDKTFVYSYFEPGIFFNGKISATLNLLFTKLEFSHTLADVNRPFEVLTFGNKKIALGLIVKEDTVNAIDMTVSVPSILLEYFDVESETVKTKKISVKDIEFTTEEGVELKVSNGKITLPDKLEEGKINITAAYSHTDGHTYTTIFYVLPSGGSDEQEAIGTTQDNIIATNSDADYIQYIPPYNYFFYVKDGKYGVLNMNGEIHIPAKYDSISKSKIRFVGDGEWVSSEGAEVHLFDSELSGEFQGYTGYWLELDGSLTKGALYGYGNDAWDIVCWDSKNNCAVVCNMILGGGVDNHYVYSYEKYLQENNSIKTNKYTFIQSFDGFVTDEWGLTPNVTSKKYGLFNYENGEMITDFIYDDFFHINSNISVISVNNEWRLIDSTGKYVDSIIYNNPNDYSNEVDSLFGYNDRPFVEINGYIVVKTNEKYGMLDSTGKQIIEPIYNGISNVSADGYYWIKDDENGWCLKNINSLV